MKFISKEESEILGLGADEDLLNEILSRVYNAAIEKALTKLPEVVSRMVANTAANKAMTKEFYSKNERFVGHKEIVASVVQEMDAQNPGKNYSEILEEAAPIIEQKIETIEKQKSLLLDKPSEISLNGNGILKEKQDEE
jgi:hypothetical protein